MIQPEILYEDAQLIICYKPAGIATQTKKLGQKDMVSILLNHVAQEGTGQPFIGVVHRLDQPVEGVMVFAKTKQAAAKLSALNNPSAKKRLSQVIQPICRLFNSLASFCSPITSSVLAPPMSMTSRFPSPLEVQETPW